MFNYEKVFSRNIGLLSNEEQQALRGFRIGLVGQGGVGSAHLLTAVRQGFERFRIIDPDKIEDVNFQRHWGASTKTQGKKKVHVMKQMALDINPECQIESFAKPLTVEGVPDFLDKIDLVIDGVDFFEIVLRREVFNRALERGIPVITAGPIGFGSAFLIFLPGGPDFDAYFGVNDRSSYEEMLLSFALGLTPSLLQTSYMHNVSIKEKHGPSSVTSVNLCAGIAVHYALRILLKKGSVKAVPYYHQFDMMKDRYIVRRRMFDYLPFVKGLKIKIAMHMMQMNKEEAEK